ncbi:2,3-bisphosphoglycerate-independent phosphoglycerate mutase [Microvenator marinus]|uniref:2,3-bisphosphoglycerate-independent phosphoglycerate mutase n=1 Tax=Microvenator marinus TaxID=2600177 RepID=A0A5B8XN73_9DELT|nr:2,3-bisphosphoglycerate-independent phosphoglycerate mutase [Microvenator marinus]QED27070.1 2,3-bisphosphoglycerate-independent phosphoglycerate mutase [Microvenator marinus]
MLKTHNDFEVSGPVVVVVLDGVGVGKHDAGDAVFHARTPTMDWLDDVALKTTLLAHGTHVGMPSDADMGNSEVGHNALGAGKIYDQGAKRVDVAIRTEVLFERGSDDSETFFEMVDHVTRSNGTLHLIGLLSDGNVHSHIDHVEAITTHAARLGIKRIRLHALLDGRDVDGQSAHRYIEKIEAHFEGLSGVDAKIASGGGRMLVTMDRYEAEWDMVERGWKAHVLGEGPAVGSALEAVNSARKENPDLNDQYIPPFVVHDSNGPVGTIEDGDAVLLFNFRGDRAIELSRAFEESDFDKFERHRVPDVFFVGMMQYDGDLGVPARSLVKPSKITSTMGELLASAGVKQLAVSETQKYGHVTYFWNGNRSEKFREDLEVYIEVPSDRVTFDQRPWMKAAEITDATIEALNPNSGIRFARVNYPNGDMVGHTGDFEAAVIAVEATDLCLKRLLAAVRKLNGVAIVTADHGNSDQMYQLDKNSEPIRDSQGRFVPMTAHTLNPVPLWIYAPGLDGLKVRELATRRLSNVAPTALYLLGLEPPEHMDDPLILKRSEA